MTIGDDFTIDYVNQRVYHSSGTTLYTVNELYTYLQETFDELAQMDDTIPMSAQTPTQYSLINGWFIDDDSIQFLKGGAIETTGWLHPTNTTGVRILTLDGLAGLTSADIGKAVAGGTTGDTGDLLHYNTTDNKLWVRTDAADDLFDNASEAITVDAVSCGNMTAASVSGENLWANIYTLGSIEEDLTAAAGEEQQVYIAQNGARIFSGSEWWPEGGDAATTRHIDVLIKVREGGTEIDGGQITVFLRHYQSEPTAGNPADLYDHFPIDLTSGGRNAVPLATADDLNNTSYRTTVSGYNDIDIAFVNGTVGYSAISGAFTEFEVVTQAGSGATGLFLYQTTTTGAGTMTLANVNGTFSGTGTLTGGTSSATAAATDTFTEAYRMVKQFDQQTTSPEYSVVIDCASRPLTEVYEYLKYVTRVGSTFTMYPTTYVQGGPLSHATEEGQLYIRAHEDTQTVATNTYSPVKASPFGTLAGGRFFGAQGIWVQNMDAADVQNYQLIDAAGTTQTPPNQQTITISNLLSDDRVSVFRTTSGTTIDKAMYTAGAGNVTDSTDFVVTGAIASDTPSTGSIRIVDTSDTTSTRETRYTYTSWATSTFSGLSPALDRAYTQTDDTAYVPFIDQEATTTSASVTVIYTASRSILVRVRRKTATAILPFELPGTFGSSGYSTSAIRTTDTIVGA